MTDGSAVIATVMTGVGAMIGTVVTATIQILGRRGEARATAADLVTHAAGGLAEQQGRTIERLERELERQRTALLGLLDVVDELVPQLPLDSAEVRKLKTAIRAAKMAS